MTDRLRESFDIYDEAMHTFKPYAVVLMLSGGDDSLLCERVCNELGIKLDYIIHGVTGTGIAEARKFVHEVVANSGVRFAEADAGDAYYNYVMRKGFFGSGDDAHTKSYHVLKAQPFRTAISRNLRHGKRNRNILLLNGVRVDESENRADKLGDNYFNFDPAAMTNVWTNIVHWWTTKERDEYLAGNSIKRNPVSIALGRSGECMCGTMQTMAIGLQAAEAFPEWGEWWRMVRKEVVQRFPWDWSKNITKYEKQERKGQKNIGFNENTLVFKEHPFMPMCVGCKAKFIKPIPDPNQLKLI
jgi:3'-phosphoadenosine 5'-phosphosulfate sulfotransferase (PAPS reductase)/FAD synthetase